MPSLPASQLVEDGEADGAYASPACDPDSEEPPAISGGARKSVSLPPGARDNGYCKMFFTESAARGLIRVIDVIDHAWRPIDTSDSCWGVR